MPFTHILLPVDGSAHAKEAVARAIDVASDSKARVTILYCLEKVPSLIGGEARAELTSEENEQALGFLEQYRIKFEAAGIKSDLKVMHGSPAVSILEAAEQGKCDIIIMGTRGLNSLESLLMGSVTTKVLNHTDVPVMVVRSREAMDED